MNEKEKEFLTKLSDLMAEYGAVLGVEGNNITVELDNCACYHTIYLPTDLALTFYDITDFIRENA